jgi:hypothetical protein
MQRKSCELIRSSTACRRSCHLPMTRPRTERHEGTGLLEEPLRDLHRPAEIDLALGHAPLHTDNEGLELIYFLRALDAPNISICQGSGGHAYFLAELAYRLHQWGSNVFVMPKHGGRTVNQLMSRHLEVLQYVRRRQANNASYDLPS